MGTISKLTYKRLLVVAWIAIVFGYLWLLSFAYEKDKGFVLFTCLAIAGNLACDGLKIVLRFDPLYTTEAKSVVIYVSGFVASMAGSVAAFVIGAQLYVYRLLPEWGAQAVSAIGFLSCMAAGIWLIGEAERRFCVTNRA
ncbi:MAG: hypothetical protein NUV63_13355 [Gallionella sp.]|nr:hypothetical protein [Gallionella sp.]